MDPDQEQNDHHGTPYYTSRSHRPHDTPQTEYIQQPEVSPVHHNTEPRDHSPQMKHTQQSSTAHHSDPTHRASTQHALGSQDPNLHSPFVGAGTNLLATPAVLPVPHMMALVMSQLQPILEAFNHSLVHMQSQLRALTLEVAELKGQSPPELQASSMSRDGIEGEEQPEQLYQELKETQNQLQQQQYLLDANYTSLLNNLTRLRTDMNAMNHSLSELKLDQKQPSSETSALWTAIERLDNRVVNNTVKVQELVEDSEVVLGRVEQLHRLQKDQDKRINDTSRRSQVQFMETGLEVEAAKVVVLQRVDELAGNMSLHGQRLADLDVDVDYLYTVLYKQNSSSSDCSCSELRTVVTHLQTGLSNVTELANQNKMALEESEEQGDPWEDIDWQPAMDSLQQQLHQMKSSWTLEENRTRAVERSMADLSRSLQQCQADVTVLQQTEAQHAQDSQHLRGSFNSLLKDAIRHSDVLELLLGEEVLEFLDWPIHDQEVHSIPVLKEQLRQHEELLSAHNQSIARLTDHRTGSEEIPPADQPSTHSRPLIEWPSGNSRDRRPAREHQSLLRLQLRDGSDLWKLEQAVEELQRRVESMEKKNNSDQQLQDEVMWLKRGLEDHLKVFKNIFSNTDKLAASKQPLDLDKVFELVKSRQRRKGELGGTH